MACVWHGTCLLGVHEQRLAARCKQIPVAHSYLPFTCINMTAVDFLSCTSVGSSIFLHMSINKCHLFPLLAAEGLVQTVAQVICGAGSTACCAATAGRRGPHRARD
jgi:hypothetical protein